MGNYHPLPLINNSSDKYTIAPSITYALGDRAFEQLNKAYYSKPKDVKIDAIYLSKDAINSPQLGDLKIEYWGVPEGEYSVLAVANNSIITPLKNDSLFIHSELTYGGKLHSHKGLFAAIAVGKKTMNNLFQDVHDTNDILYVVLRFCGLLFLTAGFNIFGYPLQVLFSWIPFIGALWERIIFKLMLVIGSFTSICLSVYFFFKYNHISNLTIYDLYFAGAVIVFVLFCNGLRASVTSGGKEVYSESF